MTDKADLAVSIASLLFKIGLEAAALWSVDFDAIMAELKKRHAIDGTPSDAAAAEMDSHLSRPLANPPTIPADPPDESSER